MIRAIPLLVLACVLALPGLAAAAATERFPTKPVRLIVPFTPGGSNDIMGRLIGGKLHEAFGQPFIIDNRPGAGSTIGIELVARANPDGYTILTTSGGIAITPALYKLSFDPAKDLAPLAYLAQMPYLLTVSPSSPVKTVQDLIKTARAQPGKLTFASSGAGTSSHLTGEMFKLATGVDMLHIPFKGGAPAVNSNMSGEVNVLFNVITGTLPHARSGKLRALGVSSLKRADIAPEIPTIAESGVPDYEVLAWYNMFAPAGTPRPVVERLNSEINKALEHPETRERMRLLGVTPVGGSPEALAKYLRYEMDRWAKLIKDKGIRLN